MSQKNRCTEKTLKGTRCKNKKYDDFDICYVHCISKFKKKVLKIENWYYKFLVPKKEAVSIIEMWWLKCKGERCPICMENFTKDTVVRTYCGHRFCKNCLLDTISSQTDTLKEDFISAVYLFEEVNRTRVRSLDNIMLLKSTVTSKIKCPLCRTGLLRFSNYYLHQSGERFCCRFYHLADVYLPVTYTLEHPQFGPWFWCDKKLEH
jgi:hypothetical protein